MTTEGTPTNNSAQPRSGALLNLLANALTVVAFSLMAVGMLDATATWKSHAIGFVSADRVRVTQSAWWGLASTESLRRASPSGWTVIRPSAIRLPLHFSRSRSATESPPRMKSSNTVRADAASRRGVTQVRGVLEISRCVS